MFKILYIEDTENNRVLVIRSLEKKGYQILTAADAEQGLVMADRELPDLILMDMGLPGIDGWEATRRLKANPKLRHIPVVALTAHAMKEERDKSFEAGCDDYDTKPFEFARLVGKIETILAKSSRGPTAPKNQPSSPT